MSKVQGVTSDLLREAGWVEDTQGQWTHPDLGFVVGSRAAIEIQCFALLAVEKWIRKDLERREERHQKKMEQLREALENRTWDTKDSDE